MEKNTPVEEFREGTVKAALFEREVVTEKGNRFTSQSIALQLSFLKNNEWQNRNLTIVMRDLPKVIKVLQEASAKIGASSFDEELEIMDAEISMEREAELQYLLETGEVDEDLPQGWL